MAGSQHSGTPDGIVVSSLLEFIESQIGSSGTFEISLEALCARVGISQVDAYRALYRSQGEIGGYIPERFNAENINVLARFLSRVSGKDAEKMFQNAGAYLSSGDLSELAALYYDTAGNVIAGHTPQKDEYRQMYTRFKTLRRAFDVYIDYFFDLDQIYEDTAGAFVTSRVFTFPRLGSQSARNGLSLLIERHIISVMGMFEQLYETLAGEQHGEEALNRRIHHPALQTLGLNRPPKNKKELRDHYKTLMKTYHPDLNPDGLEICKNINAAYAELLAAWGQLA